MNKRNKIVLILLASFAALALLFLILGFALSGNDIIAWLGSKWAMWVYVILGLYGLFIFLFWISDKIRRI